MMRLWNLLQGAKNKAGMPFFIVKLTNLFAEIFNLDIDKINFIC